MWFSQDEFTVRTDMIHATPDTDIETAVRFVRNEYGSQTRDGVRGWYCGYVVMRDADFDRISDRIPLDEDGYPEIGAPGGTTFFNRAEPFVGYHLNPGYAVLGWDYTHGEPSERSTTLGRVMRDSIVVTRYLTGLFRDSDAPESRSA